jgi:hypothetical protein
MQLKLENFDNLCTTYGWHKIKSDPTWVVYTKKHNETEYFEIQQQYSNRISVSIPMKNIPFQYKKQFFNETTALEYMEERFKEFNS